MYVIKLWVSNQPEGVLCDTTEDYIRATGWTPREGVGYWADWGLLAGEDGEVLWLEFHRLQHDVELVGHGDGCEDLESPILTAKLPEADGAAGMLQQLCSRVAISWRDWCKGALVKF